MHCELKWNTFPCKEEGHCIFFFFIRYKTRGDFAADVRLIFNNCQTFNEDDSEVGRAGHNMRKFFEVRWKQLLLTSPSSPSTNSNEEKMEEGGD